jgi:acyl-CoA thioester hydrolase
MIHEVRVIFGDTDQMGVVYYANYLRYMESARAALLRARGSSGAHLRRLGVGFPVVEAHCRYRLPARYEDLLAVDIAIAKLGGAQVRFVYRILRGDALVAEGYTLHACVGDDGRPRRLPDELRELLADDVVTGVGSPREAAG